MTPEQCRELAEYHEHMWDWCRAKAGPEGVTLVGIRITEYYCWYTLAEQHQESARYWREKADG